MINPFNSDNGGAATAAVDDRRIATMRLILAAAALLITLIDPTEPVHLVPLTYSALFLYLFYSILLLYLTTRTDGLPKLFTTNGHWFDAAWYTLFITLNEGTRSIFFFGYFFAILVASFRFGFTTGLRLTITSVVLFTLSGLLTSLPDRTLELNRFLLRPIYLLVLGY